MSAFKKMLDVAKSAEPKFLKSVMDRGLAPQHNRYFENFSTLDSLDQWRVRSDKLVGGFSTAELALEKERGGSGDSYCVLRGVLSTATTDDEFLNSSEQENATTPIASGVGSTTASRTSNASYAQVDIISSKEQHSPPNATKLRALINRSGFATASKELSLAKPKFIFFTEKGGTWDASNYTGIEPEVPSKHNDRVYMVLITPQSSLQQTLFSGYVVIPTPNEWTRVHIDLKSLLMSSGGRLKEIDQRFDYPRIRALSFGVADERDGPYELKVRSIKMVSRDDVDDERTINLPLDLGDAQTWMS